MRSDVLDYDKQEGALVEKLTEIPENCFFAELVGMPSLFTSEGPIYIIEYVDEDGNYGVTRVDRLRPHSKLARAMLRNKPNL